MAMKGVDVLVLVDVGTAGSPEWEAGASQRGATLSESVDTVETTTKGSGGYKTYEYGIGDWTISMDGAYIKDDACYTALVNAMRQKKKVKVRWQEESQAVYEGEALVTSRDLEGPYDGEATYSIELQGSGAPVLQPTP